MRQQVMLHSDTLARHTNAQGGQRTFSDSRSFRASTLTRVAFCRWSRRYAQSSTAQHHCELHRLPLPTLKKSCLRRPSWAMCRSWRLQLAGVIDGDMSTRAHESARSAAAPSCRLFWRRVAALTFRSSSSAFSSSAEALLQSRIGTCERSIPEEGGALTRPLLHSPHVVVVIGEHGVVLALVAAVGPAAQGGRDHNDEQVAIENTALHIRRQLEQGGLVLQSVRGPRSRCRAHTQL